MAIALMVRFFANWQYVLQSVYKCINRNARDGLLAFTQTDAGATVSEFFDAHSRKYSKKRLPILYRPTSFTGRNMRIRL